MTIAQEGEGKSEKLLIPRFQAWATGETVEEEHRLEEMIIG